MDPDKPLELVQGNPDAQECETPRLELHRDGRNITIEREVIALAKSLEAKPE